MRSQSRQQFPRIPVYAYSTRPQGKIIAHYSIPIAVAEGQARVEELFYSKDTHHDIQKTILTIQFCRDKAGIQKTMAAQ